NLQPAQSDQRGCSAINQKALLPCCDVVAGLQPAARAEGVAASHNRQFHGILSRLCAPQSQCVHRPPNQSVPQETAHLPTRAPTQALALARLATAACQRARLLSAAGLSMRAGFMKSTATRAVMSATEKCAPAMKGWRLSWSSMIANISRALGLFASPQ